MIIKNGTGSIVNITSLNAELGFSDNPGYNSSKGGLKLLSKSLAIDYAKYNNKNKTHYNNITTVGRKRIPLIHTVP